MRELEPALRAALVREPEGAIGLEHLPRALAQPPPSGGPAIDLPDEDGGDGRELSPAAVQRRAALVE